MPRFILQRLAATLPVLCIVAVIVFMLLRLTSGDPALILAGDSATPEQLENIRATMGLDKPMLQQFLIWASGLLRGDLGVSLISGTPVSSMIADRFGPSLALCLSTIILAIAVAIPLGIVAAWQQGKSLDRLIMAASVIGFSVPVFIFGYTLILIFSRWLGWLPVQGYRPLNEGVWPFFERLILPTLALSTAYIALIARIVRTSVIEVMGEDFIRTARAKGLKESGVLIHHALRNAAVPIVTIIGVSIAMLIGGVVVTESVFNIPGLGRLVLESVQARDYPIIQALILIFSALYIVINLVIDLLYALIDPRIRY
ncbi:ABC transporter permease [Brenneria goodwinii]|uniref:ABC transporter permease n=1 Tax=Brenneria goodwinii TaxID=1109412 RepID=UPI000EF2392D|nr:ABC transporter permease [Brenneria goodwinii]MCG8158346.1 ABC transporter permease [Brenneria goodwinii]MCG8161158.1 ABC transporter permease [Brenneria goodwinii]MCG8165424.1 ABC transporter permease [Brenneria goodwinii]MCG8169907.1 ABC transporter permease [Brenneria goodwinii]MCG8177121.1 ABC transporter permease [Brenneria goodwinii]